VGFQGSGVRFTGDLVDVSTTGLLMRTDQDFELGAIGRMAITIGHETCRVIGVAKRRIPGVGVAFEFSHMSPRDRELLRLLMLRIASTPGI
jgi:hypothetical protein